MRKVKTIISLMLAFVMLVVAVGCSGNESSPATKADSVASEGAETSEDNPFIGDWWCLVYKENTDIMPGYNEYRLRVSSNGDAWFVMSDTGDDLRWPEVSETLRLGEQRLEWSVDGDVLTATRTSKDAALWDELRFEYHGEGGNVFLLNLTSSGTALDDITFYPTQEEAEEYVITTY